MVRLKTTFISLNVQNMYIVELGKVIKKSFRSALRRTFCNTSGLFCANAWVCILGNKIIDPHFLSHNMIGESYFRLFEKLRLSIYGRNHENVLNVPEEAYL